MGVKLQLKVKVEAAALLHEHTSKKDTGFITLFSFQLHQDWKLREKGAMEQHGARLVFPIDVKKKPWEQKLPLHNRWHPDIPPVAEVTVGELFRVEMVDFSGGRITKEYSAEDIKNADPSIVSCSYLPYCLCVPVKLALISFLFQYLLHGSITIYIYA